MKPPCVGMDVFRSNVVWGLYSKIVLRDYMQFETLWPQHVRMRLESSRSDDYWDVKDNAYSAACGVIVFSALTLEALWFDFAARRLGDDQASQLDKNMSPPKKWLKVLELVSGHSVDKRGAQMRLVQELFKTRNELVHAKSETIPLVGGQIDSAQLDRSIAEHYEAFPGKVENARRSMVEFPRWVCTFIDDPVLGSHVFSVDEPPSDDA